MFFRKVTGVFRLNVHFVCVSSTYRQTVSCLQQKQCVNKIDNIRFQQEHEALLVFHFFGAVLTREEISFLNSRHGVST